MYKVILAIRNKKLFATVKSSLIENGYSIADTASDFSDCLRKIRVLKPDVVIMEYGFSIGSMVEIIDILKNDKICPVVILANQAQKSNIESVILEDDEFNVFLYSPFNKWAFISFVEMVVRNWSRLRKLEEHIKKLQDDLETRKLVERAKGILMKELKLDEELAMRKLQKLSMDHQMPIKEVARRIIEWKMNNKQ
ncbi:ANTAR domain-containing protein [Caldicellulosiruptor changbaiensis]|uniref:Response regulator receiver and ANTAR domain protein n=2 Tax=Caldicellulosiruptor TaxID=44000 RepID=A4XHN4_CALS8|nr:MULTISPECIES: ANTAR domain-containing protein [Caldicellulosiruptor]ABP66419.1 response regulator receiver and ANTAR domain protein [Caldicellulosiruptor saccharolyticus DSM 8903]AZT91093.1 ANTAR domain-containing protein [Caldicellulosiruptor changbaiensis]